MLPVKINIKNFHNSIATKCWSYKIGTKSNHIYQTLRVNINWLNKIVCIEILKLDTFEFPIFFISKASVFNLPVWILEVRFLFLQNWSIEADNWFAQTQIVDHMMCDLYPICWKESVFTKPNIYGVSHEMIQEFLIFKLLSQTSLPE